MSTKDLSILTKDFPKYDLQLLALKAATFWQDKYCTVLSWKPTIQTTVIRLISAEYRADDQKPGFACFCILSAG